MLLYIEATPALWLSGLSWVSTWLWPSVEFRYNPWFIPDSWLGYAYSHRPYSYQMLILTHRHKIISLIVLVTLTSLLSMGNDVIKGFRYGDTIARIFLSLLTTLFLGGSALYYLYKERSKYAYAFITIYYLALILATFAALYSVAKTGGVNQFFISTSFYLNHLSRTYLFAYWFLFFTTFFTICSIVIVILSTNLLLDLWNREKTLGSMSNSDLIKDFFGCARTYWQHRESRDNKEIEIVQEAISNAKWNEYELNRRKLKHSGLFEAFKASDAAVRDTEESKVLKSLEGRPEWEDVSVEHRTLAKLSALWKSFWRDSTD